MSLMTTLTGKQINPLDFRPEDFDIRDVARGLALENRFAGQTRWPVSVALHSLGVSMLCDGTEDAHINLALQGLLHDASEAYLGDMVKWVKESPAMEPFREAEDRLQDTILRLHDLPTQLYREVAWADKFMVRVEAEYCLGRTLAPPGTVYGPLAPQEHETVERRLQALGWAAYMAWEEAETRFLASYNHLMFRMHNLATGRENRS